MELKAACELIQQLIYTGARVQVWLDQHIVTVLTIQEADGQVSITTIRAGETNQRQSILTTNTAITLWLPQPAPTPQDKAEKEGEQTGDIANQHEWLQELQKEGGTV